MIPGITKRVLLALLARSCRCSDQNQPTDWTNGAHIPHHCDCPMYPIELPDRNVAPVAFEDAVAARKNLVEPMHTHEDNCRCEWCKVHA